MNPSDVPSHDRLGRVITALLPGAAALSVWAGGVDPPLFPEEEAAVARATPSRRSEFARGRACARNVMSDLALGRIAIARGAHRQPLWPVGVVGSITHCEGFTGAVAARSLDVAAIGFDAEPARPLPVDIGDLVMTPAERAAATAPLSGTVLFSAKESVHKALFPGTGVWMDFRDVDVEIGPGGSWTARPSADAKSTAPGLTDLVGRYAVSDGLIFTVAYLEPERAC